MVRGLYNNNILPGITERYTMPEAKTNMQQ